MGPSEAPLPFKWEARFLIITAHSSNTRRTKATLPLSPQRNKIRMKNTLLHWNNFLCLCGWNVINKGIKPLLLFISPLTCSASLLFWFWKRKINSLDAIDIRVSECEVVKLITSCVEQRGQNKLSFHCSATPELSTRVSANSATYCIV